jgi:tetratricopeptide (TPR) repeat protein
VKQASLVVKLLFVTVLLVLIGDVRSAAAQEMHPHKHDPAEKLGKVNFVVSCTPKAQTQFNRAVAWLHSFEYEEAEKAFTEVTVTDAGCGMGYWGIAMSGYHPLWAPPTAEELKKGSSAIEKAKAVGVQTERERDYIAAIEVFYKDAANVDHRTRSFAYSKAMEQLFKRNPTDTEAGVFYALTLIATGAMSNDKSYVSEKKAAQILNSVLAREPQHPGVTHYLIHSYDYPALAELALPAAQNYAKIAPASAHAQHMPSHIFIRLGLWQEAIRSNLDAKEAAKDFAVRNNMSGVWDEQFHAMDYLAYAYLQGAQDKEALGVLDELNRIPKAEPETFKVAYAFTAVPARYALERRRWDEAAKLTLPPNALGTFPWQRFRWAEAQIHFARAVGAARTGNANSAREDIEKLAAIHKELVDVRAGYDWAKQVEIERLIASSWLALAEGKNEESLRLMREAADLDDATDKHPVTPGSILPAREQLGELLLEMKQPAAALQEFETSLRSSPNRFNGIYGAARSARLAADQTKLAADREKAKSYYAKLLELSRWADGNRPEIAEAKAFIGETKTKESASIKRGR